MTAVFVLRHPQTTWNVAERYQGRLEAPLSEAGREQADRLATGLKDTNLEAVISSPLSRALDLARMLAEATASPLIVDARLTEIAMGPWEGLYRRQIEREFPELYARWYEAPDSVRFPSGESPQDVQARAAGFMSMALERFPSGRVLVVTHSVVIQVLAASSLGLDLSRLHRIRVSNGSISTFCGTSAPPTLLSLNGTEMLYGGPVAAAGAQDCARIMSRRPTA